MCIARTIALGNESAAGLRAPPLISLHSGTDLISPEDLLRAAMQMGPLGLPMRLRDFASGVRALESVTRSSERGAAAVTALVHSQTSWQRFTEKVAENKGKIVRGMDAPAVAERLGIALALAVEALRDAEEAGRVCRDDSIEGLFYFAPPPTWAVAE